jgi:predicted DNA-binding protein
VELTTFIRGSESWEQSYKDSPATFKRLLKEEALLQVDVGEYLIGLAQRAPRLVDWSQVDLKPIHAAAVSNKDSEEMEHERQLLYAAVYLHLLELTVIGAQAGEYLYDRPMGVNSLTEYILDSAAKHTAQLVSSVTETTRQYLRTAIEQSIKHGEDYPKALERIQKLVANPVRAEMIAQTESVNAYQTGLYRFADATGAKTKTWDALSGACKLCSPLDGKTIAIDKLFTLPNGHEVDKPTGHVRCRCGCIYNY